MEEEYVAIGLWNGFVGVPGGVGRVEIFTIPQMDVLHEAAESYLKGHATDVNYFFVTLDDVEAILDGDENARDFRTFTLDDL